VGISEVDAFQAKYPLHPVVGYAVIFLFPAILLGATAAPSCLVGWDPGPFVAFSYFFVLNDPPVFRVGRLLGIRWVLRPSRFPGVLLNHSPLPHDAFMPLKFRRYLFLAPQVRPKPSGYSLICFFAFVFF